MPIQNKERDKYLIQKINDVDEILREELREVAGSGLEEITPEIKSLELRKAALHKMLVDMPISKEEY